MRPLTPRCPISLQWTLPLSARRSILRTPEFRVWWSMQPGPPQQPPQQWPQQPPPYPYPPQAPPPYYQPPVPPKKSNTTLVVILVVVALVVIGALAAGVYLLGASSHTVRITAENLDITGATNCWTSSTGSGEVVPGGAQFTTTWTLSYTAGAFDPNSCTVQSVSVQTAGFSLVSANTPLTVPDGGSQSLTIRIQVPNADFTGVLTLLLTVTSP